VESAIMKRLLKGVLLPEEVCVTSKS
jgi:hypothetical protein